MSWRWHALYTFTWYACYIVSVWLMQWTFSLLESISARVSCGGVTGAADAAVVADSIVTPAHPAVRGWFWLLDGQQYPTITQPSPHVSRWCSTSLNMWSILLTHNFHQFPRQWCYKVCTVEHISLLYCLVYSILVKEMPFFHKTVSYFRQFAFWCHFILETRHMWDHSSSCCGQSDAIFSVQFVVMHTLHWVPLYQLLSMSLLYRKPKNCTILFSQ